jgi:LacI family transcriptional regulator
MTMPKTLGLKKIAEVAGISLSTASRALKDDKRISLTTRKKVRAAVALLKGHPAYPAVADASQTQFIALILPQQDGWVGDTEISMTVLESLQEACEARHCTVLTGRLRPELTGLAALGLADGVHAGGIVGYRLHDADAKALADAAREAKLPFVLLNRVENESGGISLGVDHEEAGRLAARYLLDRGHQRIGMIFRHPDVQSSRLRLQGIRQAMKTSGASLDSATIKTGVETPAEARQAAVQLTERGVTALIVDSDRRAIAAMDHLQRRGISIPRDLSIIGFDGTQNAALAEPALTSIYTPWKEMTQTGVRLLMECAGDPLIREGRFVWKAKLIPGASCAPAGSGRAENRI